MVNGFRDQRGLVFSTARDMIPTAFEEEEQWEK